MKKTDDIQSIRRKLFNEAHASLTAFRATAELSEWFATETETLPHWKSEARLAGLVARWRTNRFPDDGTAFEAAEIWRKRNKHLHEYEVNLRDQLLGRRREIYRVFAAQMRRSYRTACIEDVNWKKLQDIPEVDEEQHPEGTRTHRKNAAVSKIIDCLTNSMAKMVKVKAAGTTSECNVCGQECAWDRSELVHTCRCGASWDQDMNAALNLLARGSNPSKMSGRKRCG